MKEPKIAIVGYASRLPQTSDARFWADLLAERCLITQVAPDRWAQSAFAHPDRSHPGTSVTFAAGSLGDISGFDAGFFRISPREAATMDPQQRLLLEMSWEALSHAGFKPKELHGKRCGVFIGLASTDYAYRVADDLAVIGPNSATGSTASIAANRLSYFYDWHGPSFVVDTACSSGLVAFHQACRSLQSGESDVAVTGAISLHLHPYGFVIFSKASMLSASGQSRPFQSETDGYVRSEGGGVFVLKPYAAARRDGDRILAVVAHSGINADGHKSGLTIPRVESQATLLREVYAAAGIAPDEIDYLEAHGTGTAVGDPIEVEAIGQALGQTRTVGHRLPIGSVKSNLGHLETASAIPGLLKAIHALRTRTVPPTIGVGELNPNLPLDRYGLEVVTQTRALRSRGRLTIGVNSFGFGGANAHVILQTLPTLRRRSQLPAPAKPVEGEKPVMLTAATASALKQVAGDLYEAVASQPPSLWEATLYQLNFRREWLNHRALLWVSSQADLLAKLKALAEQSDPAKTGQALTDWQTPTTAPLAPVWVFSGNGCQWEGMGRDLLEDPVFARTIDAIDSHFEPLAGYRLRDELLGLLGDQRYALTQYAQPALFALQVGQVALLREQGFKASAVIGHSVGEVAAAWACGALTLGDATRVVYFRSHAQEHAHGLGQMTAVAAPADTTAGWLLASGLDTQLAIAAHNSPRGCTVVGETQALDLFEDFLRTRSVPCKRLPLNYPFHGPHMDPLREPLRAQLADLDPHVGDIPFFSTVTGKRLSGKPLDADYWWHNVREPVRFTEAFTAAARQGAFFVELGGHPVLRGYMQDVLTHEGLLGRPIETLHRNQMKQREVMQAVAGALWIGGLPPRWERYFPQSLAHVDLPHYPWERERYWHDVTPESTGLLYRYEVHPLLGHPVAGHADLWEQRVDTLTHPWLADHQVGEGALFPGAGYVELMLATAAQDRTQDHPTDWCIEDLEILAPMLLEAKNAKILRTRRNADGRVEIQSRSELGELWTLHARGRISPLNDVAPPPLPLPESRSAATWIEADQHYALATAAGLHYGPAFRTVTRGQYQGQTLWADLAPFEASSLEAYVLHPALLDGAFQLFIDYLADDETATRGWGFVPVRIERLSWHSRAGRPTTARARLLRRSPQSFLAEVQLLDAQGQVCATGTGVRMRRMRLLRQATERVRSFKSGLQSLPHRQTPSALEPESLLQPVTTMLSGHVACQQYAGEYSPLLATYLEALNPTSEDTEALDIEALWHTLLQDYPDFLDWTLAAGRTHLASRDIGEGHAVSTQTLEEGYRRVLEAPARDLASTLADALQTQLMTLPATARLTVLELTEAPPELLPRLATCPQIHARMDLFHADPAPVECCESCGWTAFALGHPPLHLPPVDLLWVHLDAREPKRRDDLIALAASRLRPGGLLLLSGLEPEPWWPLLHIPTPGALQHDWQKILSAEGLPPLQTIQAGENGHWLIVAQQEARSSEPSDKADWLLMSNDDLDWLDQSLGTAGCSVHRLKIPALLRMEKSLEDLPWTQAKRSLLLHIAPGAMTGETPAQALLQSCETLRRLGLWARRQKGITHLDLLLPGALADTPEETGLQAQGLAAFARTLQNEWPELQLRILDADPAHAASRTALIQELLHPDAEREVHLDASGARQVTRIEVVDRENVLASTSLPVQRLTFSTPGQLSHLAWRHHAASFPGPDEVEVNVSATGLNFRDVMYTLGLLSDEALENGFSGPTLGLEFAGTLTAIGENVEGWAVGDRVLGFAAASFSNRLITSADSLAPLPDGMSFTQGATVPTVFFTAWYALKEQARVRPGERVLIHGGAGGVGIAAIQIAQQLGAEILATAGTPAKRDFLRLLGVQHVYDSRSLDFADRILHDTRGEGVDVVLNSLAGEAMRKSLHLLKPFGRFLELGKRDFYADTPLGLRPMRNNLSYFGIDADQMMAVRPALTQDIFKACLKGFEDGSLSPLPATRFSTQGVIEAFRHMQHAQHIGKIVIDMQGPFLPQGPPVEPPATPLKVNPQSLYLITGGTSGFGLKTAQRLVDRGARRLILVSRSGHSQAPEILESLHDQVIELHLRRCDVADATQIRELFAEIGHLGPLRGIVHAAAVIDDTLAENLDPPRMRSVLGPKVDGAWHLHRLSLGLPLDFFVVYSSIANLLGNVGQAPYVSANGYLEALVKFRRAQGLPGTAIGFGPIADAGFLTRNASTLTTLEKRLGGMALSAEVALDALEKALIQDTALVSVADLNWGVIRRHLPLGETPKYADLDAQNTDTTSGLETADLRAHLATLDEAEGVQQLGDWIVQDVAKILRLAPEKIDRHKVLTEMGFDSLMGMELVLALEERLDLKIPTFVLNEAPTLQKLAQRLLRELAQDKLPGNAEDTPTQLGAALAKQHGVGTEDYLTAAGLKGD